MIETGEKLIFNFNTFLEETDPEVLKSKFEALLEKSGFQVVGFTENHFTPQGYTCVWILAESHLALHTFPEKEMTYLELSSCSEEKNQKFISLL